MALATASMRTVAGSSRALPSPSATSVATCERHSNEATQSTTLRDAFLVDACSRSSVSRTTASDVLVPSPTHSLQTSQWLAHSAGARQMSMPSITACTAGSIARESSCKLHPASSIGRCLGSRVSSSTSASSRLWIEVHQSPCSQPPSAWHWASRVAACPTTTLLPGSASVMATATLAAALRPCAPGKMRRAYNSPLCRETSRLFHHASRSLFGSPCAGSASGGGSESRRRP